MYTKNSTAVIMPTNNKLTTVLFNLRDNAILDFAIFLYELLAINIQMLIKKRK